MPRGVLSEKVGALNTPIIFLKIIKITSVQLNY